jgi:subtilisin-like proprotein convertase family protein
MGTIHQQLGVACAVVLALAGCGSGGTNVSTAPSTSPSGSAPALVQTAPTCSQEYANTVSIELDGPDPLAGNLWHLKNTGQQRGLAGEDLNVEPAWAMSLGTNVTIALIDDAVETQHPDLARNINPTLGLDYRGVEVAQAKSGPGSPCDADDYHGTAVGGIIGARYKNGIGTVGVSPGAKMVGYSALATPDDSAAIDALTRDLSVNDIYNNSWGSPDTGELWLPGTSFADAIERGVTLGRAGKGAVYVFPSGNGGCALRDVNGQCQAELSSYDGYLNAVGVLVVSAIDRFGKSPSYAEQGANILVSAPGGDVASGITTTSLNGKYTNSFAGTSAAAPMVSGVVALMLSANPSLSWRDVRLILAYSARRNDASHLGWQRGPNGGRWFNPSYGYGAVDAHAAVSMAQTWITVGTSASLKRCEVSTDTAAPIPDNATALVLRLGLDASCNIDQVEHVELVADIAHEYSGDLDILLVSPSQTQSQLAQARMCDSKARTQDDCGAYADWRFASVRHLDEPAKGVWSVQVRDMQTGKLGRVNGLRLVVYGR